VTDIGYLALVIGFAVAAYSAGASFIAGRTGHDDLWLSARNAVWAVLALASVASAAMVYAFISRDFSVKYVAEYSSRDLSLPLTIAAWWAGQAGSILLWAWLLSVFAGIVLVQNRRQNQELTPYVTAVMMAILTFFLGTMAFTANPFEKLPTTPADGLGLNPLLQNEGMYFHPTTLYLGYVGFTVPFAFAMAALITGRLGDEWIRSSRRWTLFAWFFLGMGNLFGAQWAYTVLGWGGFWGWDPVENASFMPWLTGTAYLHSVMIQQRRGMLKVWNLALIIITFALSLFGTLLTRSGLLSSVHSFAQGPLGTLFITLIVVVLAVSLRLLWQRLPQLRSEHELDSFVSRESSFLFNNLLLVGAAFAIFWGTIFPLITEAVRGVKITVGPPFYNQVAGPIFLGMIVLMGVCPLIGWRKASRDNLARNFMVPLAVSLGVAALLHLQGIRSLAALPAFWALSFVAASILLEFYRGARARVRGHKDNLLAAVPRLIWANKPRYGGYIVHVGVILIAMGVASTMIYSTSVEATLAPGEKMSIRQYDLTLTSIDRFDTEGRQVTAASLAVTEDGRPDGTIVSEKALHRNHENPVTSIGLRSNMLEDLYIILVRANDDGTAAFKVLVNPLMTWIWIGGGVLLLGTAVAFWPDPRERDRAAILPTRRLRVREVVRV
jgi:cytochrome c-type biogenesis protein CcmF